MEMTLALVAAAASVGSIHSLAPDHWVPFVALSRARRWPPMRTAALTALCGLGHVSVSVLFGVLAALLGLELLETFGRRLETLAGVLLVGFGVVYALWGLHIGVRRRWHDHGRGEPHWHPGGAHAHLHQHGTPMSAWALFVLFSADPCVAVIPLIFATAPLGWTRVLAVVAAYEIATIGTMVGLVMPARAAVAAVGGSWVDRYGDAMAGGVITIVGLAVLGLGL